MFAELLLGKPLFPGGSTVDQFVEIVQVISHSASTQILHVCVWVCLSISVYQCSPYSLIVPMVSLLISTFAFVDWVVTFRSPLPPSLSLSLSLCRNHDPRSL